MSLRAAVNAMCRSCVYDPLDYGTCAQQIACCTNRTCELYSKRPITCKSIPMKLLDRYGLSPEDLDDRARGLLNRSLISAREAETGALLDAENDLALGSSHE